MPDGADHLMHAIVSDPADIGARLAYADWLEERGDPRGEFIRLQFEIGKQRLTFGVSTSSGAFGALMAREALTRVAVSRIVPYAPYAP